jgi:hypothetical protein
MLKRALAEIRAGWAHWFVAERTRAGRSMSMLVVVLATLIEIGYILLVVTLLVALLKSCVM